VAVRFGDWKEPDRILSLAQVAVAERPGTDRAEVERALKPRSGDGRVRFFDMPEIGISSTMLRERIRAGQSTRYLTPQRVRDYIDQHGLYRGSSN
jgi:nicotinate-nucleotide adenylyltransferase